MDTTWRQLYPWSKLWQQRHSPKEFFSIAILLFVLLNTYCKLACVHACVCIWKGQLIKAAMITVCYYVAQGQIATRTDTRAVKFSWIKDYHIVIICWINQVNYFGYLQYSFSFQCLFSQSKHSEFAVIRNSCINILGTVTCKNWVLYVLNVNK